MCTDANSFRDRILALNTEIGKVPRVGRIAENSHLLAFTQGQAATSGSIADTSISLAASAIS